MAVIEDEKQSYVAKPGDALSQGWRIKSIDVGTGKVVLQKDKETINLSL